MFLWAALGCADPLEFMKSITSCFSNLGVQRSVRSAKGGAGQATGSSADAYQKGFCGNRIQHWILLGTFVGQQLTPS